MPVILSSQHLVKLRNTTGHNIVTSRLHLFSRYRLKASTVIKNYHDLLLFYCAFPHNEKTYRLAIAELKRIAVTADQLIKNSLVAGGIANTELLCSYSSAIAGWLVKKFPDAVELGGSDAPIDTVRNIIQSLAPAIEFEKSSQGDLNLQSRLKNISGLLKPGEQLKWLLQLFNDSSLPELVKEELYHELKVYLRWKLDDGLFNRSFLQIPVKKQYYQKNFIRKIVSTEIVKQKTGKPVLLTTLKKTALLDCMKASLAFQYRETDPVTYGDEEELELFDMGRGLQIAIAGMKKEKRLALESYVGYMAFKNGVPVSYGGGWLWGQLCKIGINIYSPFRRGESAWMFCQVLRVYYQHLGARQFTVKPYQFGKGNPEGLKSGAFWFYYKLGFCPVNEEIKKIAEAEWEKIQTKKNYRSPLEVMQHFTRCNLAWMAGKNTSTGFDAAKISTAISTMINRSFAGNRKKAIAACLTKMKKNLPAASVKMNTVYRKQVIENWSLLTGLLVDITEWNAMQKRNFIHLIKLKQTGKEKDFIIQLQKHERLWKSLHLSITKQANKTAGTKNN